MHSIDEFVNRRWADAKEKLRQLDPSFVAKYEELAAKARSEDPSLEVTEPVLWLPGQGPVSFFTHRDPRRRLSKEWHSLLEDCYALTMLASIVETGANNLTAETHKTFPQVEAGRQSDYHKHSYVIHSLALLERVKKVITCTTALYISDDRVGQSTTEECYHDRVKPMIERLQELRHEFVHPRNGLGAEALTKEHHWEHNVAVGFTAQVLLNEFYWPIEGERSKRGEFEWYVGAASQFLDELGFILHELEQDIAAQNPTNPR